MAHKTWLTSESVTEGHSDKICDQISDAILDEALRQDPSARVAVETVATNGLILLAGEVTTTATIDYEHIARDTLRQIGYSKEFFLDPAQIKILVNISKQSPDIAQGVDNKKDQGAGDQGLMYGFATKETPELLPLPIALAHKLTQQLAQIRKNDILTYLGPDGKSQVSIEYNNGVPARASAIVVSTQHAEGTTLSALRQDILKHVIVPVCGEWIDEDTKIFINPTGRFVLGGPAADTGLTGRKIIVDTYGGVGRHGGGAFSGKDPSKVDRSGAYAARWIAKSIVAAGLAEKCEVQVSYCIGVAQPTSIHVDTFGTNTIPEDRIVALVKENFDLRRKAIIEELDLLRPIYQKTAAYGHFGRNDAAFTWEKTKKLAEELPILVGGVR